MAKKKRKDLSKQIICFGIFVLVLLVLLFYITSRSEREVYASVIVSDRGGFDIELNKLTFGMIQPGFGASRAMTIQNNLKYPARVVISAKGDIKDFIYVEDNNFILNPGEKRALDFSVQIPRGQKLGKYEGKVIVNLDKT